VRGPDRAPLAGGNAGNVEFVGPTNDIADFLTSRRAKVTPEQMGLPTHGSRRVPGLRREEVASLAGVSVEYYKRLERGNASGVSDSVLEALAHALQLDDAERAHLFDLARAASPLAPKRRRPVQPKVRPVVDRILDSITAPAIVRNSRVDYLAANPLGRALYAPLFESREQPPNSARFTFIDPAAHDFYSTGTELPRISSRTCAPRPVATRTTAGSPSWLASSRCGAPSSVPGGRPTTCATTKPAASGCDIRSSAS
jgi:transcriptional regulator with XRE-family HTH domain